MTRMLSRAFRPTQYERTASDEPWTHPAPPALFSSRHAWGALLGTLLACVTLPSLHAASEADGAVDEELLPAEDQEEYERVQASLEGVSPERRIQKLQEYLRLNPESPNREAFEAQLATLLQTVLSWQVLDKGQRVIHSPLSFSPAEPAQRLTVETQLQPPYRSAVGMRYQHPITTRWSVEGYLGGQAGAETLSRAGAAGRYTHMLMPSSRSLVAGELGLGAELGADSRLQVLPRVYAQHTRGPLELQGFMGLNFRLGNEVSNTLELGASATLPVESRWLLGLELAGWLRPVEVERTDLPTSTTELFTFWNARLRASYLINRHYLVHAGVSCPVFARYRLEERLGVSAQLEYRFGSR